MIFRSQSILFSFFVLFSLVDDVSVEGKYVYYKYVTFRTFVEYFLTAN